MKIPTLVFIMFLVFLAACTNNKIQNIRLDGDLIAKQIVTASYNLPPGYNYP